MNVRKGYQEELHEINEQISRMGKQTTTFVAEAVEALAIFDTGGAETIRHHEREIDALHREIEEKCIAIIATQQPVAVDLRFLIASIKISAEIERIADYANNIAKITHRKLSGLDLAPVSHLGSVIGDMGSLAINMLTDTLRAYESRNHDFVVIAKEQDAEVNSANYKLFNLMIDTGRRNGSLSQAMLEMHTAIRYLERSADRAVNIAEWVFYMGTGFRYVRLR
ncbi:phosphate signaling complex protein PhoU [Sporomusa sp. KB1]|jgi:phosphate transport system protein|uniref:phosphate signaling complex protein PhoU n=1 Tax=Sporomusa sp. KB1 TaxID=943346 RepID=UPI0011A1AD82|nr:phosphate signaling complex protein PhoU [Sporomusa sp. KB1]TWH49237.1 PhoU-like phosphate uptake regulator [Sporomusa sp. KB1]